MLSCSTGGKSVLKPYERRKKPALSDGVLLK